MVLGTDISFHGFREKENIDRDRSRNLLTPKTLFPRKNVSETPHMYLFSPTTAQGKSPIREIISVNTPIITFNSTDNFFLLSSIYPLTVICLYFFQKSPFSPFESKNDNSALKVRVKTLEALQQDLIDDVASYKEENKKLIATVERLETENRRLKSRRSTGRRPSLPNIADEEETEDLVETTKSRLQTLQIELKNVRKENEQLLEDNFNKECKIVDLDDHVKKMEQQIQCYSRLEDEWNTMLLEKNESLENLEQILLRKTEAIEELQKENEEMRDCLKSSEPNGHYDSANMSGIFTFGNSSLNNSMSSSKTQSEGIKFLY